MIGLKNYLRLAGKHSCDEEAAIGERLAICLAKGSVLWVFGETPMIGQLPQAVNSLSWLKKATLTVLKFPICETPVEVSAGQNFSQAK